MNCDLIIVQITDMTPTGIVLSGIPNSGSAVIGGIFRSLRLPDEAPDSPALAHVLLEVQAITCFRQTLTLLSTGMAGDVRLSGDTAPLRDQRLFAHVYQLKNVLLSTRP